MGPLVPQMILRGLGTSAAKAELHLLHTSGESSRRTSTEKITLTAALYRDRRAANALQ